MSKLTNLNRQDIYKEWCAALRSGHYKQGKFGLCEKERYCCLGVLCSVLSQKGAISRKTDEKGISCFGKGECYSALPTEVCDFMKITSDGMYDNSIYGYLVVDNDIKKLNFYEIAQIIEKNINNFERHYNGNT